MSAPSRIDSVGWKFFLAVFLLVSGFMFYLIWNVTLDSTPIMLRGGYALFLAGMVAAIISWLANCILGFVMGRDDSGESEE